MQTDEWSIGGAVVGGAGAAMTKVQNANGQILRGMVLKTAGGAGMGSVMAMVDMMAGRMTSKGSEETKKDVVKGLETVL